VTILDANAILRYILDDIPEQANKVEEIISSSALMILPEVVAEVVYVMTKSYGISRKETSEYILTFLSEVGYQNDIIVKALQNFGEHTLDFVDCVLLAYSSDYKIFTFDEKLLKAIKRNS